MKLTITIALVVLWLFFPGAHAVHGAVVGGPEESG